MNQHVTILGWLYIIFGGLVTGLALAALAIGALNGPEVLFFGLIAAPALLGGIGLLRRIPWFRNLMMLYGALNLLNLPIGTALGIYTLWVLWSDEGRRQFTDQQPPPKK